MLFQSGPPVGASMLLKKLRGELLEEAIEEAFKTAEEQQESRHEEDLLDDIYIYQTCTESAGTRRGKAARDWRAQVGRRLELYIEGRFLDKVLGMQT